MDVIQTKDGLFRRFWNLLDCPCRGDCEGQESREKRLGKIFYSKIGRCSFNPSIYDCKYHPDFNPTPNVKKVEKVYDLNCL